MVNKIPAPPTGEATLDSKFERSFFDDTVAYQEPPFLFEFKGVGFSPLGGIQALSGQKKNGKSIFASILMATALSSGSSTSRFATRFPGLRLRQSTINLLGHEPRVLYVDTEQEKENTDKVIERAKWLAEMESHVHNERLTIQWLRAIPEDEDPAEYRKQALLYAIDKVHPDLVLIDGIRDLVHDFNDIDESSKLINELMALSTKHNMCVWCTLHMNPRPSNDDESKMRGHLGTELGNKASDVFTMKKKKDKATGLITFTMQQLDARGKDIEELVLTLNDDAGVKLGAPIMVEALPFESSTSSDSLEMRVIKILKDIEWKKNGLGRTQIFDDFAKAGVTSHRDQENYLNKALDMGVLEQPKRRGPYFFNKKLADGWGADPLGASTPGNDKAPF
jgi:archaellum biogenesis ATPase FlaH